LGSEGFLLAFRRIKNAHKRNHYTCTIQDRYSTHLGAGVHNTHVVLLQFESDCAYMQLYEWDFYQGFSVTDEVTKGQIVPKLGARTNTSSDHPWVSCSPITTGDL